jgi:hypothetical protein
MPFPLALILSLMVAAVSGVDAEQSTPFTWWTTHPLVKVRPLDPIPGSLVKSVDLYAGRNEFEPFQIVLRTKSKDLSGVDITFSDFRNSEGAAISAKNITVYLEEFVKLQSPSSIEGGEGFWPDPLIPRIDRYANEARNGFPFTVRHDRNQPLWVEVYVPVTAHPGKYTGSARVSMAGAFQFSVPIRLTVWRFALPSTSTLKSSFGLSGINALKQHRGRYTNDEDLHSITNVYTKAALLHRITTHGGSMQPPKFSRESGGNMRLDWRDYDAEVGPFLNGSAIPDGEPLPGARVTSAEIRTPEKFEGPEQQKAYWTEWTRHFQQKGWYDRLFLYLWDEPAKRDFPELLKRGRAASQVEPRVRSLVTIPFTPKLEDVVQIWVPLVNCLEPKAGFPDFCDATPPFEVYAGQAPGKSLWFYQSCASHGCNIIGGDYFNGWPSYMIDMQGAANRVMQWVAWKFQVEGELYYSMNESYGHANDPWENTRMSGGNGDGTLFYPGLPKRIGGRTDIPIESIRLKLIREGMEDYEYLAQFAKLAGRQSADQFAAQIVRKSYLWESRPDVFLKVRKELGEALDRVVARSGETM